MSLKSNIGELVTRWRDQDIEMHPPFPKEVIHQVFNDIGVPATDDVVALYESLGGMSNMNDDNWRIWSLQEISHANQDLSEFGVIFSDYLLDCYHFRLKPVSEAVSEVWIEGFDDGQPVCVAKSLDDFFERYVISPESVLHAPYRPITN
ncbi:hypothetical protein ACO0LL_22895 [Undibacterium sp. TC4M20W]|uniref:hypothetical protein n=1 Tax=unclassified Undibacterium TaxID=2630295 RepID=UPI003BEFBEBD